MITIVLLLCILITQSGCLAIAAGALAGMALGEMGNNIERNKKLLKKGAEQKNIENNENMKFTWKDLGGRALLQDDVFICKASGKFIIQRHENA